MRRQQKKLNRYGYSPNQRTEDRIDGIAERQLRTVELLIAHIRANEPDSAQRQLEAALLCDERMRREIKRLGPVEIA